MKSVITSIFYAVAWCFLASVCIASLEALGYFSTRGADIALPLYTLVMNFSNTTMILLAAVLMAWFAIWFFVVWLGGVRSGMALFFMFLFLAIFGYLVVVLDVLVTYDAKYTTYWAVLMRYFGWFALVLAVVISLVLGKILRRFRPLKLTPRGLTLLALFLSGSVAAVWARGARFSDTSGNMYWGIFFLAAAAALAFLWWFGRSPLRLGFFLAVFAVAILAPAFTSLFRMPLADLPMPTGSGNGHPPKRIILVTVDTLRKDALSPYNGNPETSPALDRFSRNATVFTQAFSSAPWTYPSVTSILTGLPPRVHNLLDGKGALPEKVPTMAEALSTAGYFTAAAGLNSMLLPRSKLDRGFQDYHWFPEQNVNLENFGVGLTHNLLNLLGSKKPDAAGLTDYAIRWVKKNADRDFFFWVHYFDPHMPYGPPAAYQPDNPAYKKLGTQFKETRAARMGSAARTAEERAWIRALYAGEVRYVDAQVGRFLESLRKMGIYEDTLILFTSDHGEELWDHDRFEHGHTLYNELVQIPLIVKLPGGNPGATIDVPVSNQAIMPTILEHCGATAVAQEFLLPSLMPLLNGGGTGYVAGPISIGASIFHDRCDGIVFDGMKYIRGALSGHEQLYNLQVDPEERYSLVIQDPQNLEKGRQLLKEAQSVDAAATEKLGIIHGEKDSLDQEAVRSLQALGYL